MNIFLVGGAVRDKLLNYPFHERDWVVVGATPEQLISKGFKPVGKDFPVFLHPDSKEEYALARKERKTGHGYAGFDFNTDKAVTLEEDLSRRDLTINAIAEDSRGELIDPYGGIHDLKNGLLRHVSPAFSEDPVRVLRLARFAARYAHLGFTVADETIVIAKNMVSTGELNHLVAERVWKEFECALGERSPEMFIKTLQYCGALSVIAPELDVILKSNPHSLDALICATELSKSTDIRCSALLHHLGKPSMQKTRNSKQNKKTSPKEAPLTSFCNRLKVPKSIRELAELTMMYSMHSDLAYQLTSNGILTLLEKTDAFRQEQRFIDFLTCCKADAQAQNQLGHTHYSQANFLLTALRLCKSINVKELIDLGLEGQQIGIALRKKRLDMLNTLVERLKATHKE